MGIGSAGNAVNLIGVDFTYDLLSVRLAKYKSTFYQELVLISSFFYNSNHKCKNYIDKQLRF